MFNSLQKVSVLDLQLVAVNLKVRLSSREDWPPGGFKGATTLWRAA